MRSFARQSLHIWQMIDDLYFNRLYYLNLYYYLLTVFVSFIYAPVGPSTVKNLKINVCLSKLCEIHFPWLFTTKLLQWNFHKIKCRCDPQLQIPELIYFIISWAFTDYMTRTSIHNCFRSSVVQSQGSSISGIFVRGYVFK